MFPKFAALRLPLPSLAAGTSSRLTPTKFAWVGLGIWEAWWQCRCQLSTPFSIFCRSWQQFEGDDMIFFLLGSDARKQQLWLKNGVRFPALPVNASILGFQAVVPIYHRRKKLGWLLLLFSGCISGVLCKTWRRHAPNKVLGVKIG